MFILQCQKVQNCLKRAETSSVLIFFNGVLYHVCTCTFTISYRSLSVALYESGTRKAEVYLTSLLELKITQLQDKIEFLQTENKKCSSNY